MRFESARLRLDRAKATTADMKDRIDGFIKKHPPTPVVEGDMQRGYGAVKIKFRPFPKDWPVLTAEICEHLRHALDQAVFAASVASGVVEPRNAYFPFSDTAENLENTIKGRCTDAPPEIIAVARAFKPYRTGNLALWGLNKAANTKHTKLMPVGILGGGAFFKNVTFDQALEINLSAPRWDRAKHEIVVLEGRGVKNLRYELSVTFAVAFDSAEALGKQPLVPTLNALAGIVTDIVNAIEAESDRLWPAA